MATMKAGPLVHRLNMPEADPLVHRVNMPKAEQTLSRISLPHGQMPRNGKAIRMATETQTIKSRKTQETGVERITNPGSQSSNMLAISTSRIQRDIV